MPDFTLRDAAGDVHVVGNASDRARLLSQGYRDVTSEDTPGDQPGAAEQAADVTPTPPKPPTRPAADKPRTDQ